MANAPAFAATPRLQVAAVSTANTARDGTGTIVDIFTGGASGSRIERIVVITTGDPADCVLTVFIHNGTSYFLFDEFDMGNPAAASTTVAGYRAEKRYSDIVLPNNSHKLSAAITVALTAGVMNVFAFGADF